MHNGEFHNFCLSILSRRGNENTYAVLVWKPQMKRSYGKPRHRRKDNLEIDHREIRCEGEGWIELAQSRTQLQIL
jgi:hypothetical protein